ncbi:MAG TPA: hypothetical protein EYQ54_19295 [Myxococcales bacterium]|nr:hypothetical protein [Myxococcales bacterium]
MGSQPGFQLAEGLLDRRDLVMSQKSVKNPVLAESPLEAGLPAVVRCIRVAQEVLTRPKIFFRVRAVGA